VEEELTQMSLHNLFTEEYSIREGRPIQTFDRAPNPPPTFTRGSLDP